ncbi:MAG: helix-turn-helix transcriptional regulator [Geminicoccaceae bacterium]
MLAHQLTAALCQCAFLVDQRCMLLDMTAMGRAELRCRRIVRVEDGRLAAGAPVTTDRLRKLVGSLAGGADDGRVSLVLPALGGRPALALLSRMPGAVDAPPEEPGRVLCHLLTAEAREAISEANLAAMFGLTPAEARVARSILDGRSLRQTAQGLVVSPTTARTHLQRVFDKTGTRRQAELIRLLSCYDAPLGPSAHISEAGPLPSH